MTPIFHRIGAALTVGALLTVAVPGAVCAAQRGATLSAERVDEIRHALDEKRLLDASRLIDGARSQGVTDARLSLLTGELGLASRRFDLALGDFRAAGEDPAHRAEALQGQGLALVALGRPNEARPLLERAVREDPKAWRAWNALGALHDSERDWTRADEAYANAIASTEQPAIVLNNRGYSLLLQGKYDAAVSDLVAALQKKADLAEARTNLRLVLALRGDYDRAIAGTRPDERSALLNNAGFAAGVRGDYEKARELLQDAIDARGEHFTRAEANRTLVEELAARETPSR